MSLTPLRRLFRRASNDDGFSMVVTIGAISMLMATAAISMQAISNDQPHAQDDRERKAAFAAAEAGLQVYMHKLAVDASYWTRCAVPADGVNLNWNKPNPPAAEGTDPRVWKNLPDGTAAYTMEILPANDEPRCLVTEPEDTVVDKKTATFRIRVTGQARTPTGTRVGGKRSLIATFKRRSFLDFIYFTDFEVMDPITYTGFTTVRNDPTLENPGANPNPGGAQRNIVQWGNDACAQYAYLRGEGNRFRDDQRFNGNRNRGAGVHRNGNWQDLLGQKCSEIRFVTGDLVQGPLHSNDSIMICGQPIFGRSPQDLVETSAPGDGRSGLTPNNTTTSWRPDTSCSGNAPGVNYAGKSVTSQTRGTWKYGTDKIVLPPSNRSLSDEAPNEYTFVGQTTFNLQSNGIYVTGRDKNGTPYSNTRVNYPGNGVIYVEDSTTAPLCSRGYDLGDPYGTISGDTRQGCGIANVMGTYNQSLTIGAADDIVIRGNVRKSGAVLLGLIANNFVRVYHPVTSQSNCRSGSSTSNASGSLTNPTIEAALLTLTHSFIVDNYMCGSDLGELTVEGAISQKFRGPVGTGGRNSGSGYIKNYIYDDRLQVRSPPSFLDPVQASWRIKTYQEQAPAQ